MEQQPLWPIRAWFDAPTDSIIIATYDNTTGDADFTISRTYDEAVAMASRLGRMLARHMIGWTVRDKRASLDWGTFESSLLPLVADYAFDTDPAHDSLDLCAWQDGQTYMTCLVVYVFNVASADANARVFSTPNVIFLIAQLAKALVDYERHRESDDD